MTDDIHHLLLLDDRGESRAKNAPARLIRSIFADINLTPRKWDQKVRSYIESPRSGIPDHNTKRSSERSNLNRALVKDTITWKTFRKAISILEPTAVRYELHLTWDDRVVLNTEEKPKVIHYTPTSREDELCQMFRLATTKANISPRTWDMLIKRHLDLSSDSIGSSIPDRSTERGNLRKALLEKNSYTWQTFCRGLDILTVTEATLSLYLKWPRRETFHAYTFNPRKEYHGAHKP